MRLDSPTGSSPKVARHDLRSALYFHLTILSTINVGRRHGQACFSLPEESMNTIPEMSISGIFGDLLWLQMFEVLGHLLVF